MYAQDLSEDLTYAFQVDRGHGFDGKGDGLCYRNVVASLTHIHALGVPGWAEAMVERAGEFRNKTSQSEKGAEILPCLPAAGLIG